MTRHGPTFEMTTDPRSDGESARDQAQRLYQQAARLARLGAWECDLATEHLTWTDGVYDLFDLAPGATVTRATVLDFYFDESRHALETMRAEANPHRPRLRARREDPDPAWRGPLDAPFRRCRVRRRTRAAASSAPSRTSPANTRPGDRLRQIAERDALTGLANRRLFDDHYRATVTDPVHHDGAAALALIDIDHFKDINDNLGHLAGDECLRQVAMRLQRLFADAIVVARIGGDEFAVLLRAPLGPARIRHMLRRAADAIGKPVLWGDLRIDIGASIGATILGRPHLRKLADLFTEADTALYAAKHAGRKALRIFGEDAAAANPAVKVRVGVSDRFRLRTKGRFAAYRVDR